MKIVKNILFIVVLLSNSSLVHPRAGGGAPAQKPIRKPSVQPKRTPATRQPARSAIQARQPKRAIQPQTRSYKDLVMLVKNSPNAWNASQGMLNENFIATMIQKVRDLGLEDFQLEALLQTARDAHGVFSGNQNKDVAILLAVDEQIMNAIQEL